jgi:hypothetical protein
LAPVNKIIGEPFVTDIYIINICMKLLHFYFDNEKSQHNGLDNGTVHYISELTNTDPGIMICGKNLFTHNFMDSKGVTWIPADDSERYFYPICCTHPMNDSLLNNRYTGYAFFNIPDKVITDCRNNDARVLLFETWEGDPWWHYMEMITDICRNNTGLKPCHFIVVSGNLAMPIDAPFAHVDLMWFQTITQPNVDFAHIKHLIETNTVRPNHFLLMNRRPAPHRLAIIHHLWEHRSQGAISFAVWPDMIDGMYHRTQELYELDADKLTIIKNNLPLRLGDNVDPETNPVVDYSVQKFLDSHLQVIPETFYGCKQTEEQMFFSEKTFKPMQFLQPFVLINYVNSLVALREAGYETFSKWINEDYDAIENLQDRTLAVGETVKEFCTLSPKDAANIRKDMLPVLEHNYHQRIKNSNELDNNMYGRLHAAFKVI